MGRRKKRTLPNTKGKKSAEGKDRQPTKKGGRRRGKFERVAGKGKKGGGAPGIEAGGEEDRHVWKKNPLTVPGGGGKKKARKRQRTRNSEESSLTVSFQENQHQTGGGKKKKPAAGLVRHHAGDVPGKGGPEPSDEREKKGLISVFTGKNHAEKKSCEFEQEGKILPRKRLRKRKRGASSGRWKEKRGGKRFICRRKIPLQFGLGGPREKKKKEKKGFSPTVITIGSSDAKRKSHAGGKRRKQERGEKRDGECRKKRGKQLTTLHLKGVGKTTLDLNTAKRLHPDSILSLEMKKKAGSCARRGLHYRNKERRSAPHANNRNAEERKTFLQKKGALQERAALKKRRSCLKKQFQEKKTSDQRRKEKPNAIKTEIHTQEIRKGETCAASRNAGGPEGGKVPEEGLIKGNRLMKKKGPSKGGKGKVFYT